MVVLPFPLTVRLPVFAESLRLVLASLVISILSSALRERTAWAFFVMVMAAVVAITERLLICALSPRVSCRNSPGNSTAEVILALSAMVMAATSGMVTTALKVGWAAFFAL